MVHNIAAELLAEQDFTAARHVVDVEGLSSPAVCNFLNRLVARMDPDESYLEVGTWRGLTLLSAAHGNFGRTCVGCDKFRFCGRYTGWGFAAKRALGRNIARYRQAGANVVFHHMSAARLFAERLPPARVGVYFYDGDHSAEGTAHGIVAAAPFLAERAIVLVDDWNDPVIRAATDAGLARAALDVLWSRQLEGDHSPRGWWNGLGVFYVEAAAARAAA